MTTTKQAPSLVTRAAPAFIAFVLLSGMFIALQLASPSTASAGTVPPPAACGTGDDYDFANSACWGAAGNPPSGCLDDGNVVVTAPCLAWKAKLPAEANIVTPSRCPANEIAGPGTACCVVGDQDCLQNKDNSAASDAATKNQSVNAPAGGDGEPTDAPVQINTGNLTLLTSGLTYFSLVICVGGIFVSAALWAVGSKGQNEGQQHTGKRGFIVCLLAAFLIGALPTLFSFYDSKSQTVNASVTKAP